MIPVDIFLHEAMHVSACITATGLFVGGNLIVWLLTLNEVVDEMEG